jgi:hypothetical protein
MTQLYKYNQAQNYNNDKYKLYIEQNAEAANMSA